MKKIVLFLMLFLVSGCSSSKTLKKHDWTRYSIKRFQILKEVMHCDTLGCNREMKNHMSSNFVLGEYWPKKSLEWNTQWIFEKGRFAKPIIYIRNGISVAITFCDEKYFTEFHFDSMGVSRKFEPFLIRNEIIINGVVDYEYSKVENYRYRFSDSLITIETMNGKNRYLFFVEEKKNVYPKFGKQLNFAEPFALFPETSCKEKILPFDSRF